MARSLDLGILLGLGFQTFVDELRADLAARGFADLGSAYGYVFRALDGDTLHLHQLAERLSITAQGASKIITEMEQRGYVERVADPHDGRAKQLRLADRGRAALGAARRFHARYERRLRAKLGAREVIAARRVLEAMVTSGCDDVALARLRAL